MEAIKKQLQASFKDAESACSENKAALKCSFSRESKTDHLVFQLTASEKSIKYLFYRKPLVNNSSNKQHLAHTQPENSQGNTISKTAAAKQAGNEAPSTRHVPIVEIKTTKSGIRIPQRIDKEYPCLGYPAENINDIKECIKVMDKTIRSYNESIPEMKKKAKSAYEMVNIKIRPWFRLGSCPESQTMYQDNLKLLGIFPSDTDKLVPECKVFAKVYKSMTNRAAANASFHDDLGALIE